MKFFKNKQKGFTLIELLLYVTIASTLLLTVSIFMTTLIEARVKNQTISEVEQQGAQIIDTITSTIRGATGINLPIAGSNGASLSLNVSNGTNSPTIFNLSGGVVYIKEGPATEIALNNTRVSVSGMNFQNLSRADTPGNIRVSFVITYINNTGRNEYTFSKTFYGGGSLRN